MVPLVSDYLHFLHGNEGLQLNPVYSSHMGEVGVGEHIVKSIVLHTAYKASHVLSLSNPREVLLESQV